MATIDTGIATPCTKVCVVHPASRLCLGCGRSLDEIAGWAAYSDHERARIMAQLPPRLKAIAGAAVTPASA